MPESTIAIVGGVAADAAVMSQIDRTSPVTHGHSCVVLVIRATGPVTSGVIAAMSRDASQAGGSACPVSVAEHARDHL